jgi:hypothetical protein
VAAKRSPSGKRPKPVRYVTYDSLVQQIKEGRAASFLLPDGREVGFSALLLIPNDNPTSRPESPAERTGNRLLELRVHLRRAIVEVLKMYPEVTRTEIIQRVEELLLPDSGVKNSSRFDRHLVLEAHKAYISEDPKQRNCKSACQQLSKDLQVTPRTIENYLRLARPYRTK